MDKTLADDTLMEMAKRDTEALAMLYHRYLQRVYSYLLSRVGNAQDAQDLTTQTFIAMLEGIEGYEPRGYFAAWLLGIAKRKLADHYRNTKPIVSIENIVPVSDDKYLDTLVIERLQMQDVVSILAKINPDRAEALRLRYFGDMKIREIADLMEKSEGAIKMLLARGLDDIRHVLNIQEEIS